jgi:predicted SAM-dependent methyltransferase
LRTPDGIRRLFRRESRDRPPVHVPNLKEPGCYLNLGCGPNIEKEFCNLDRELRAGVDVCCDATKGLPFPDAYVSGIFSEHMIEHVSLTDALFVFRECRRILRKGGVMRIVVPDGDLYLAEYAKYRAGVPYAMPLTEEDERLFPFVTPMISVNRIFREYGHRFMWDFETLRAALLKSGFETVERRAFGEGADPKLLRDAPYRQIESLYLEAS